MERVCLRAGQGGAGTGAAELRVGPVVVRIDI